MGAIGFNEVGALAGYAFNAVDNVRVGVGMFLYYNDRVAGLLQLHDGVRAYIAGSACD